MRYKRKTKQNRKKHGVHFHAGKMLYAQERKKTKKDIYCYFLYKHLLLLFK